MTLRHGQVRHYCELHGWVPKRHWAKHQGCEMELEVGTVLVNPRPGVDKIDRIRVLSIVEDSNGDEIFVLEKMFATPEREKTAGHHKHMAMTRKNFATKYGTWAIPK